MKPALLLPWRGVLLILTAAALLLLPVRSAFAAGDQPADLGYTVTEDESLDLSANTSNHVYLCIVVLGHLISGMENASVIIRPRTGILSVDYVRSPDWDGIVAGPPDTGDTTLAQIHATVRAVEALGYKPASIRWWRRPVPLGFDFRSDYESAALAKQHVSRALQVGFILVDLGSISRARRALARFDRSPGPFDSVNANVRFGPALYIHADCNALRREIDNDLFAPALRDARDAGALTGQAVSFAGMEQHQSAPVLCADALPSKIYWTMNTPPGVSQEDIFETASERVQFNLAPRAAHSTPAPRPPEAADEYDVGIFFGQPYTSTSAAIAMPENRPYISTVGQAWLSVIPDAAVLDFARDLDSRDPGANLRDVRAHVRTLRDIGVAAGDLYERTTAEDGRTYLNVFVRVHPATIAQTQRIYAAMLRPNESLDDSYMLLFSKDCGVTGRYALERALEQSRRKAQMVAAQLHTVITVPLALHDSGAGTSLICGFSGKEPLAKLTAARNLASKIKYRAGEYVDTWLRYALRGSVSRTVQAAWAFATPRAFYRSKDAASEYTTTATFPYGNFSRGAQFHRQCEDAQMRALHDAVQAAQAKHPQLWSVAEQGFMFDDDLCDWYAYPPSGQRQAVTETIRAVTATP